MTPEKSDQGQVAPDVGEFAGGKEQTAFAPRELQAGSLHHNALPGDSRTPVAAEAPGALSREQNLALLHIVAGYGAREAARVARVNRGTVYRWLRDQAFCREVREARRAACMAARLQLFGLLPAALELVRDAMDYQEIPAAMAIVRAMKLLDRLGTVEAALAAEAEASAGAGVPSGERGSI